MTMWPLGSWAVSDRELTAMPAEFTPAVAFEACFDARYGLVVTHEDVAGEGVVRGRVQVVPELLTRHGLVHGGVFASAAEALASRGTALIVIPAGFAAMGQGNDTTVLEPVSAGAIELDARVLRRSEDAWLWTVESVVGGTLVAFSRVTVAVRPFR
jgi:1,4-dihydroxy-2-naphthoyl-CoA hydrolase